MKKTIMVGAMILSLLLMTLGSSSVIDEQSEPEPLCIPLYNHCGCTGWECLEVYEGDPVRDCNQYCGDEGKAPKCKFKQDECVMKKTK